MHAYVDTDMHTSDCADNGISSLKRKIVCVQNTLFIRHRISLGSTSLTLKTLCYDGKSSLRVVN